MLNKYRKEIDKIDEEMKDLFLKRLEIVEKIANYKLNNNVDVLDVNREKEMLTHLVSDIKDENTKKLYISFLFKIMELSKIHQKEIIKHD